MIDHLRKCDSIGVINLSYHFHMMVALCPFFVLELMGPELGVVDIVRKKKKKNFECKIR